MLEIFNDLEPFFKDNYQRIGVREYARKTKISPPTASKKLKGYEKETLLIQEQERNLKLFHASRNKLFQQLQTAYWTLKLEELTEYLEKELLSPTIILFGSTSKAEAKKDSDIDLAIFTNSKKQISFEKFEKKLGKTIQAFIYKDIDSIENKHLKNNVLNGAIIHGEL